MTGEDEAGLGLELPVKRAPAQDLTGISAAALMLEMDGDAFQRIARLELARILKDLARRVRYIGAQDGMKLKAVDANGARLRVYLSTLALQLKSLPGVTTPLRRMLVSRKRH
jgi:hypothetical protein